MIWLALFALIAAVVWLLVKWNESKARLDQLERRLQRLEFELERMKRLPPSALEAAPSLAEQLEAARPTEPVVAPVFVAGLPPGPPPLPPVIPAQPERIKISGTLEPVSSPPVVPRPAVPAINWEKFLGVKLFAWVGGLALFLGVAFFIKYSFDQNLVSPQLRVALGYLVGLGLLVGGLFIPRPRHAITAQTLCATGVVILYANIFASHAYYHFLGPKVTFALMALVTATAFLLSVRLEAQVVAVLGLLGGFLTPPLLSTGVDNPGAFFGYLAILDLGLLAVALRQRWNHLALLAALATAGMQFAWVDKFFAVPKIFTAMSVFLGFTLLFVAAFAVAKRLQRLEKFISAAAILMPSAALAFVLYLLWHPYPDLAQRVVLLFSFVFLVDLGFLAIAWLRDELRLAQVAAGGAVFLLLTVWTAQYLSPATLNAALAFYLLFAALHSVFPVVLQRLRPTTTPLWWIHLYSPLALLLILIPLLKSTELSWLVWPVVLLIDLVAIALAVITASLASILAVFVLTALVTALWIFQMPPLLPDVPGILIVIGGFALFFMGAGIFAARKVFAKFVASSGESTSAARSGFATLTPQMFSQIASLGAMLPFLLLTLVVLRLPLANPSPVFGLAALLVVMLLGVLRFYEVDWLAPVGLLSVLLLEHAWHFNRFAPDQAGLALGWYLGFGLLFLIFPFLFQRRLERRLLPWTAAALSLPAHFFLIYRVVSQAHPEFAYQGLLPAALAVPCLIALVRIVRGVSADSASRQAQLALFGGAALLFITLIFPIQFDRQWITIGWAFEGAALLWLFHRVPHPGLRLVGAGLLMTSFARLALNPWVISEYGRTGAPIWNWYLYAYGLVAACLMLGAWLLAPPRHKIAELNAPPILYGLGTVLAFLLVNIEIADYFSSTGSQLTFNFSGNFAQDTAYSLAWGLFAFALLGVGFKIHNPAARYSGLGLLIVTLLKLFLHDLWRLGGLYRIGSLIGLAVVLILVSFIYQRFFSSGTTKKSAPADGAGEGT